MKYDTVIVGAGAAGCVLAARLSEDPTRSVALVEAGPDYPTLSALPDEVRLGYSTPFGMVARSHDWGYTAKAGEQTEPIIRGKIVGGSSAVNAQIYLWGLPYDFDRWAGMGNTGWSWEEVEPWFRKVETDLDFRDGHGTDGPIPIRRYPETEWNELQSAFYAACRSKGYPDCPDLNKPYATGVGAYPMNNPDGIRVSAAIGYLNEARQRPNLTILPDTHTLRIKFSGTQAVGLDAIQNNKPLTIDASEVIVCAGAIGTPLLLMRSGVGNAVRLAPLNVPSVSDLPGVGQNLRDHPAVPVHWKIKERGVSDTHWHQVGLRYTASGSEHPDDMIVYVAQMRDEAKLLMRPTVNLAESAGSIWINSADPEVPPHIDYGMFVEASDLSRMLEAIRLCIKLVEHDAFAPQTPRALQPGALDVSSDRNLESWIRQNATTGHHVSGTCRMGLENDRLACADPNGMVYGTRNLRVADASLMPDCVRANIHATVLMLAEKIAASMS